MIHNEEISAQMLPGTTRFPDSVGVSGENLVLIAMKGCGASTAKGRSAKRNLLSLMSSELFEGWKPWPWFRRANFAIEYN